MNRFNKYCGIIFRLALVGFAIGLMFATLRLNRESQLYQAEIASIEKSIETMEIFSNVTIQIEPIRFSKSLASWQYFFPPNQEIVLRVRSTNSNNSKTILRIPPSSQLQQGIFQIEIAQADVSGTLRIRIHGLGERSIDFNRPNGRTMIRSIFHSHTISALEADPFHSLITSPRILPPRLQLLNGIMQEKSENARQVLRGNSIVLMYWSDDDKNATSGLLSDEEFIIDLLPGDTQKRAGP